MLRSMKLPAEPESIRAARTTGYSDQLIMGGARISGVGLTPFLWMSFPSGCLVFGRVFIQRIVISCGWFHCRKTQALLMASFSFCGV